MSKYFLLSFLLLSYMIYGWAISRFFSRSRGMTTRMRLLALLATATTIVHAYSLWTRQFVNPIATTTSFLAYSAAMALFALTCWATKADRLPIAFDPGAAKAVVTAGPYRFVRHPFYVGYSLTWLAGALSTSWWPAWCMTGVMVSVYFHAALREERRLLQIHPEAYMRYQQRTGAFFPRFFALSKTSTPSST